MFAKKVVLNVDLMQKMSKGIIDVQGSFVETRKTRKKNKDIHKYMRIIIKLITLQCRLFIFRPIGILHHFLPFMLLFPNFLQEFYPVLT